MVARGRRGIARSCRYCTTEAIRECRKSLSLYYCGEGQLVVPAEIIISVVVVSSMFLLNRTIG